MPTRGRLALVRRRGRALAPGHRPGGGRPRQPPVQRAGRRELAGAGAGGGHPPLQRAARPEPVDGRVLDSGGRAVAGGPARPVAGRPLELRVPTAGLAAGGYTVSWRIVSAVDGHRTDGVFGFGVGRRRPRAAGGQGRPTARTGPAPGPLAVAGRWAWYWGLDPAGGGGRHRPAGLRRPAARPPRACSWGWPWPPRPAAWPRWPRPPGPPRACPRRPARLTTGRWLLWRAAMLAWAGAATWWLLARRRAGGRPPRHRPPGARSWPWAGRWRRDAGPRPGRPRRRPVVAAPAQSCSPSGPTWRPSASGSAAWSGSRRPRRPTAASGSAREVVVRFSSSPGPAWPWWWLTGVARQRRRAGWQGTAGRQRVRAGPRPQADAVRRPGGPGGPQPLPAGAAVRGRRGDDPGRGPGWDGASAASWGWRRRCCRRRPAQPAGPGPAGRRGPDRPGGPGRCSRPAGPTGPPPCG
jgi:hypothetical protein